MTIIHVALSPSRSYPARNRRLLATQPLPEPIEIGEAEGEVAELRAVLPSADQAQFLLGWPCSDEACAQAGRALCEALHHQPSTMRRGPGILMDIHPKLRADG